MNNKLQKMLNAILKKDITKKDWNVDNGNMKKPWNCRKE